MPHDRRQVRVTIVTPRTHQALSKNTQYREEQKMVQCVSEGTRWYTFRFL